MYSDILASKYAVKDFNAAAYAEDLYTVINP